MDDIIADMKLKFGIRVDSALPVGWNHGNVCWLMMSDQGELFVKVHDKIRNKRTIEGTRQALKFQNQMYTEGIPCQPVMSYKGECIYSTARDVEYTITGASQGRHIQAGQANSSQMFTLGKATRHMHKWMNTNLPQLESLHWELPSKESMYRRLQTNLMETSFAEHKRYAEAIECQMNILNLIDLNDLFACTHGWAHWDMHIDNLLFDDEQIVDIIDFDRISYVYTDFDISRALLSCTLTSNGFPSENVKAYVEGYSEHEIITAKRLVRSLKLTWYKECKWIHAKYRNNRPMSRFVEELIWIGDNWAKLDEYVEDILLS
ncbi:phosphotransferase [Paenibacillus sp. MBLB4367]|uniref:phosphotransferase n=1 Tax=Paenibacillus sp. MBLB4367 TaxID=3384767 RepID=UPI0039081793